MNVQTKKLPRGQVELTIELTTAEYEPFLRRAAETISQQTSIPGFRPGKANVDVIKQRSTRKNCSPSARRKSR